MYRLEMVVFGTGRCGTGTMARVCGGTHEKVFGVRGIDYRVPSKCDSSWMAVPWLSGLPGGIHRVMVCRNPEDTIVSLGSQPGLFDCKSEYGKFIKYWCAGEIGVCSFWNLWTRWCLEEAETVVLVEENFDIVVNSRSHKYTGPVVYDKGLWNEILARKTVWVHR